MNTNKKLSYYKSCGICKIRFDCSCDNRYCANRNQFKKPRFANFEIKKYSKYKNILYEEFDNKIAEFMACIFSNDKPLLIT